MDQRRGPIRIPRLNTADADRERSQAYRSPSASSSTSIHLPFASARSNVYLSTARPGYIRKPLPFPNRHLRSLNFGLSVATPGAKPCLLQQIEKHLEKADLPESQGTGEHRLRIFQEGFEMFINAFGVYKPVLSRIKSEYQASFEAYSKRIQCIPKFKAQLATMKDDANAKMCSMAIQFRKEKMQSEKIIADQRAVCEANQTEIASLKKELAARQVTIEKLQNEHNNGCESRKTLATALNRYKAMLDEVNADKMQLTRALAAANQKASNYQTSYDAVIADLDTSNSELEALKKRVDSEGFAELAKDLQRARSKASRLESEFLHVLDLYEKAVGKRAKIDHRVLHDLRTNHQDCGTAPP